MLRQTRGLEEIYKCKPAMLRAYNAAKALKPGDPNKQGLKDDDFVSRVEFRMLLVYLKLYYGLFLMFDTIDTGCVLPTWDAEDSSGCLVLRAREDGGFEGDDVA